MKKIYLNVLLLIIAVLAVRAHAEKGAERPLAAIVEIRITVPENARSAERFGTNRVASGVVIDTSGHILTIGFQTTEAEKIEIVGPWEYLLENAIFTAPPIEQFSGAALINRNGHLVGIGYLFSQFMVPDLGVMPANMFVPIDLLKPILSDLKLSGKSKLPPRPWLGVRTEESYGRLFVERVTAGSPSEKAGIKPGDIILTVNKQPVLGMADFYRKVWALGDAGVAVPLSILQGIRIQEIIVHSSTRDPDMQPKPYDKQPGDKL